jgi:hypothetical protein
VQVREGVHGREEPGVRRFYLRGFGGDHLDGGTCQ